MVKSSYEQLGITCGLPSPVESEHELLDFSSEAFFSGQASDDLSRTPHTASHDALRSGESASARTTARGPVGRSAAHASERGRNAQSTPTPSDLSSSKTAVIACYDKNGIAPRIETVPFGDAATYIDVVSLAVMNCVTELGGGLTPEVVFELISNLAHAEFSDPIISVLDSGDTIRVADAGPGIPNKSAAMRPGFSSATAKMRNVIRGVGAGLPLVRSLVEPAGGFLVIDDNIGGGTVVTASVSGESPNKYSPLGALGGDTPSTVTLSAPTIEAPSQGQIAPDDDSPKQTATGLGGSTATSLITSSSSTVRGVPLSVRQREVLAVVADSLEAGPSTVSSLLDIPLSTAYRDLMFLEDRGLVSTLGGGKRQVTGMGMELLRVF